MSHPFARHPIIGEKEFIASCPLCGTIDKVILNIPRGMKEKARVNMTLPENLIPDCVGGLFGDEHKEVSMVISPDTVVCLWDDDSSDEVDEGSGEETDEDGKEEFQKERDHIPEPKRQRIDYDLDRSFAHLAAGGGNNVVGIREPIPTISHFTMSEQRIVILRNARGLRMIDIISAHEFTELETCLDNVGVEAWWAKAYYACFHAVVRCGRLRHANSTLSYDLCMTMTQIAYMLGK